MQECRSCRYSSLQTAERLRVTHAGEAAAGLLSLVLPPQGSSWADVPAQSINRPVLSTGERAGLWQLLQSQQDRRNTVCELRWWRLPACPSEVSLRQNSGL